MPPVTVLRTKGPKGPKTASKKLRVSSQTTLRKSQKTRQEYVDTQLRGVLPKCNEIVQFPLSDKSIADFKRFVVKPMDCVINALQIAKVLDNKNANILRISCAGETGFTPTQLENVFILHDGHHYEYKEVGTYQELVNIVETTLKPGHGMFVGYTFYETRQVPVIREERVFMEEEEFKEGHAFILARKLDGSIWLIDPQSTPILCDITTCQGSIMNHPIYNMLYTSSEKLTKPQLRSRGFVV